MSVAPTGPGVNAEPRDLGEHSPSYPSLELVPVDPPSWADSCSPLSRDQGAVEWRTTWFGSVKMVGCWGKVVRAKVTLTFVMLGFGSGASGLDRKGLFSL